MSAVIPSSTKAIVVRKAPAGSRLVNDAAVEELPIQAPRKNEVLVRVHAVAFNHRDLWIRKGQYPGIKQGAAFGADGVGTVIKSGNPNDELVGKRVFLVPMHGWDSAPDAPESNFGVVGGCDFPAIGTFADYVIVERDQVIVAPEYLDDEHIAAWPLAGVTAWRAVTNNAKVKAGQNVLVTGIGGGVALTALQLMLAKGANVYVTSGSDEKLQKAISLGAKAGVNYKSPDWPKQLQINLKQNNAELDAIIDSAGGDILGQVGKSLKAGGRLVVYGMTAEGKITFTMREVLKNQRVIGSTMGSRADLLNATAFIEEHKIVPVVSEVYDGLEEVEKGFEALQRGGQFGKIVIKLRDADNSTRGRL